MAIITTRLSTLRARLEEKRQQIAACPPRSGKRGRVLFQTMRWLFYHAIPKNSSIYDAMVGDGWGRLVGGTQANFARYWRKQRESSYNWLFDTVIGSLCA